MQSLHQQTWDQKYVSSIFIVNTLNPYLLQIKKKLKLSFYHIHANTELRPAQVFLQIAHMKSNDSPERGLRDHVVTSVECLYSGTCVLPSTHMLVTETSASLLPLALCAPEIALIHPVHFPTLLIVRARSPTGTTRGPTRCQSHVFR